VEGVDERATVQPVRVVEVEVKRAQLQPRVEAPASHSAEAAAETERELVRRQRVRGIVAVAALEAAPLLLVRRVPTRDARREEDVAHTSRSGCDAGEGRMKRSFTAGWKRAADAISRVVSGKTLPMCSATRPISGAAPCTCGVRRSRTGMRMGRVAHGCRGRGGSFTTAAMARPPNIGGAD